MDANPPFERPTNIKNKSHRRNQKPNIITSDKNRSKHIIKEYLQHFGQQTMVGDLNGA